MTSIGLRPGDEVLMPAYHHGSEVEAILTAGLRCSFFEPDEDLQPPRSLLEADGPAPRALHLIHYLGFPQRAAEWRRRCDTHDVLLIEDAAQAWLATDDGGPVGRHGDMAVFCLYKSCGLPDGAAAVAGVELQQPTGRAVAGLRAVAAPWARRLRRLVPRADGGLPAYDQVTDISVPDVDARPSLVTRRLLHGLDADDVALRRRRNYRLLLDALADSVAEPFRNLPQGASPFVFPILVEDKEAALRALRRQGVEGLDLWSRPHPALPAGSWPVSSYLRRHVVGLPVHQQLLDADLDAIRSAASRLAAPPQRLADVCR